MAAPGDSSGRNAAVSRAVVPVAGRGTRMMPFSRAVPKALLPLVDARGRIRPVIHWILADIGAGGIDEVAVVVSPGRRAMIEGYLDAVRGGPALPARIEYVVQRRSGGFGDAVSRCAFFTGNEPFLLVLGDHLHLPGPDGAPAWRTVADAYAAVDGAAVVGMQVVGGEVLHLVGAAAGEAVDGGPAGLYRCSHFVEKPGSSVSREHLRTPGLEDGRYLAHAGIYVFSAAIYDHIERARRSTDGELELAAAQSSLLAARPEDYYLLRLDRAVLDVGTPDGYARAFTAFRERR